MASNRESKKIGKAIDKNTSTTIGELQARLLQTLTSATPVDTGFARSNYRPSVGAPVLDRRPAPSDRREAIQIARARRKRNDTVSRRLVKSYRVDQGRVFISNATPYIVRLNEGYSAQAPAMFVQRSIAIAISAGQRGETTVRIA